jgi:LPS export ABC transporter protein LptC
MLTARKIRLVLAIAIIAAIAGIVIVAMKRLSPSVSSPSGTVAGKDRRAEVALRGISVTETSSGSTKWNLVAETAEYDTGHAQVNLSDIKLSVAPIDKSLGELVLTSPTAVYHTETRDVYLNGGVRARNSKGMEFTTKSVRFRGALGIVTTTDAVRFSDEDLTLEGVGMEFNVASSALKLSKDVTATVRGGKRH